MSEIGKAEGRNAHEVVCEIDAGVVAGTENITVQNVIDAAQGRREKTPVCRGGSAESIDRYAKKLNAESRALIELQLQYVDFMINTFEGTTEQYLWKFRNCRRDGNGTQGNYR